jgi:acid phosphatase type 7
MYGWAVLLLLVACNSRTAEPEIVTEPAGMILTWQQDPTTTMTIDWHTVYGDEADPTLHYKHEDSDQWHQITAGQLEYPFSDRTIHRAEITGLRPGQTYQFRTGEFTRVYTFQTMPDNTIDAPVRFATGGDVRHNQEWMERTNRAVMEYEPDFIAWGGDLAYADGREDRVYRWYEFFDAVMNTLITDDGRVIPIIAAIGNHEGPGYTHRMPDDYEETDEWRARKYPYFFQLFAMPGQPGYNVLDFADYMSFILLDSKHANDPGGVQADWLDRVLEERTEIAHIFPLYHVPGIASVKGLNYRIEQIEVREYFFPRFEEHGIRVAFENHDHAYKRTPPMRNMEVVDEGEGVVYIGDGAWGVSTRDHVYHVPPEHIDEYDFDRESRDVQYFEPYDLYIVRERSVPSDYPYETTLDDIPYLEMFAAERHGIIGEIAGNQARFTVVSEHGEILDEYQYSLED